jgi:hypothetical protein
MVYIAILYNSHTCTLYGVKVPKSGPSTWEKTFNPGPRSTIRTFDLPGRRPTLWALNMGAKSNIVYIAILYNSHTWTFDLGKTNLELGSKVGHTHLRVEAHNMGLEPGCQVKYIFI